MRVMVVARAHPWPRQMISRSPNFGDSGRPYPPTPTHATYLDPSSPRTPFPGPLIFPPNFLSYIALHILYRTTTALSWLLQTLSAGQIMPTSMGSWNQLYRLAYRTSLPIQEGPIESPSGTGR